MNKRNENVFFLKVVTSLGDLAKSTFTVASLFYNAQRKQIMNLIAENYGKAWKGVILYIGTSDFGCGAIWRFGTLSNYLLTQDDLKDFKICIYQQEYFNGFC